MTTWRVATSRNVRWYLVGNSLSNVGTWVFNVSAALLVYRLTGSTFLVGTVTFAQFIGTVLLAPWAGSFADRFDRRKLLIVLQSSAAIPIVVLATATALDAASTWLVLTTTSLLGVAVAFTSPALQALVPLLVEDPDVDTAISLNAVTFQLARAVGPLVAAIVIPLWGLPLAIGMNAVSYLAFVGVLLVVRPRPQERAVRDRTRFRTTAAAAWADRRIRCLLLSVTAVSIATDPVTTLAPEYASSVLGRADTVAGALMGAFGVGSLFTGIVLVPRLWAWHHGFAATMAAEGLGLVLFGLAPHLALALLGAAVAGGGFVGSMTQATSRLHHSAPGASLGRLMALWAIAFLGMRPFAALVDGALADLLSVRVAAVTLAVPVLFAAFVALRQEQLVSRV